MSEDRPQTADELRTTIVRIQKQTAMADRRQAALQAEIRKRTQQVKRWRHAAQEAKRPWSWARAIGSRYLNPVAFFRQHGGVVVMSIPFIVGGIPVLGLILGLVFGWGDEVRPSYRIEAEGAILVRRGDTDIPLGVPCHLTIGRMADCEVRVTCGEWQHRGIYLCRENEYSVDNGEGSSSTHYYLVADEPPGSEFDFYFHEEEQQVSFVDGDVLWRMVLHHVESDSP